MDAMDIEFEPQSVCISNAFCYVDKHGLDGQTGKNGERLDFGRACAVHCLLAKESRLRYQCAGV